MESFSLYKLNEYIRRVIALNFQDTIWINAEISQVKLSRGNLYLDLIEKEENSIEIKAQASAILWYKKSIFLRKKFGKLFDSIIDTGNEIRIKVSVEFSERYGFSLYIEDLDPSFTLGKAEMLKQIIIDKLNLENLTFKNSQLNLPSALQKIAIISSSSAAGYIDFISHLQSNAYGYKYQTTLYQSALQGTSTEKEVLEAFKAIDEKNEIYDCIVIIRGGGSKLDLAAFDNYEIAKAIANCKYPVITGIGHDIDSSIADIVSHTDLKTPTAVADFLIDYNAELESRILDIALKIKIAMKDILQSNAAKLELRKEQISGANKNLILVQNQKLIESKIRLESVSKNNLKSQNELLISIEKQTQLLSPANVLKRGFAILRQNGKSLKSIKDVNPTLDLVSELSDGQIISTIKNEK